MHLRASETDCHLCSCMPPLFWFRCFEKLTASLLVLILFLIARHRLGLGFTAETLEIRNEHPSAFCKKVKEVVDVKDKEYAEMRKKHTADLDKIRMQLAELENKCKSNEGDMGKNRRDKTLFVSREMVLICHENLSKNGSSMFLC